MNVPTAVWIDEEGRIVRPPEPAGSYEAFRYFDAASGRIPDDEVARARQTRGVYLDAIRDWVANGPASRFVYREEQAASKAKVPTPEQAEAHARFRMGLHLLAQGNESEAHEFFARASWAMWRQAAPKLENGIAAGPESTRACRRSAPGATIHGSTWKACLRATDRLSHRRIFTIG